MTRRRRIAAWIGWLLPWAIVILDYIGRVKDILELPGNASSVVRAMVDALGNTSWQAVLIFLIGLACLLFATSHLWAPWFGLATRHAAVHQTDAERDAATPEETSAVPDSSIGELFRGLIQHPVDDAPDWLPVGNEVRDKASLGQIRIWGRPARYWDYPEQAQRAAAAAPLEPIDPSYWRDAQFNWGTVFEPETHLPHTGPLPHKFMIDFHRYNGLRVNRQEALKLWPERLKR